MTRTLMTLMIAALPFATMAPAMADATPPAKTTEVKKELQKLMNAYGAGEMSSKEYKARKEALLASAANTTTTQVGQQ
jgi:hypothetical protein